MTGEDHVTLGRGGLVVGGEERLVLSGEVHYWRLDPARWEAVLDAVVEAGFTMVSTYVPWCVHEVAPGRFTYEGAADIERFLALAGERGLMVLVRIGPDTGAEIETSGWPRRIFDDPACQARRPDGEPYLLVTATGHGFPPSYASTTTLGEVRRWYEEIVPRLAPLQHPAGPIVACQVDNEMGYHFQPNSFAMDHHPDSVAGWRQWLVDRYGDAEALDAAWGTADGSFDCVEPPTDGEDEPEARRLSWVMWREQHRRQTLAAFASWARQLGMDRVPLTHNDYPRAQTPMDFGALEATGTVDWAAADIYATAPGGRFVRDLCRLLGGGSRLPFMAELGAGWLTLPWLLPLETTAADEEVISLRAFFSGAKAANVYMLVERDRWYGSPISASGERRASAALYPRLRDLLDRIGWTNLERDRRVLLVENRAEHRRVAARDTLGALVPCFSQLLPIDPRLARYEDAHSDEVARWDRELAAELDRAGVDADRAASSSLPDLGRYDVVIVPTFDCIDAGAAEPLRRAASAGTTVVLGPGLPVRDEMRAPLPDPPVAGDGIVVLDQPGDLAGVLPRPRFGRDDDRVDLAVWEGDGRTVLAAFNSSADELEVRITLPGPAALRPLWGGRGVVEGDASVSISLVGWGVEVFAVEERAGGDGP